MADLEPLIRYRKHTVDEKQKVLGELYRQSEELQQQKEAVEEEMEHEKKMAEEMATLEASAYLGRYLEGAKAKIAAIDAALHQLESKIAIAREDMRNAFAEMKKVEITQRNRKDREKAELQKKEDLELDANAIENYRRRQEEDS